MGADARRHRSRDRSLRHDTDSERRRDPATLTGTTLPLDERRDRGEGVVDEVRADLRPQRADLGAVVDHRDDVDVSAATDRFPWEERAAYADWLAQTYYYVRHTTRLIASAAARFPIDERGNSLHHRFAAGGPYEPKQSSMKSLKK